MKVGGLVALIGGVSWVVKVALVFLRVPDLLIGVFYFGGLLGPVGAGVGLSAILLRSRTLVVQIITGIVLALVFVFLTFAVQDLLEIPFRGSFSEFVLAEIPILIQGVIWGIVGLIIWRRGPARTNSSAPAT